MTVFPNSGPAFQRLRTVRLALLDLHKALLNSERATYEQYYGRIQNNAQFFNLVIEHEWFEWLRPMSQFIVQMDDVLMSKEVVPAEQAISLLEQARMMFRPAEFGTPLEKGYFQAIQRDPNIALKHASITELLAAGSEPLPEA
ncbi:MULTISPECIES: hypothetical protein [unclassified Leptolyngbya]|uniref:hypothetical protein n=1 Tax=unclassified Leptolyngbya TaxID=2650499 RepID=UPI001683AE53|nr:MULTISPECIES: hypothetical protein [unclassified Leptolyngbya]MBD1913277.1 hypothetical protein [Leptolyngbya sp. FACHB-8]MBD2154366.1 hypothetical protein [Leptolyngbya sp. FACHB-16]